MAPVLTHRERAGSLDPRENGATYASYPRTELSDLGRGRGRAAPDQGSDPEERPARPIASYHGLDRRGKGANMAAQLTLRSIASVCVTVFLICGALYAAAAIPAMRGGGHQRCFPAQKWSRGTVPNGLRPCVKILRVFEDGSFKVAVKDANGTLRYTAGYGARDR